MDEVLDVTQEDLRAAFAEWARQAQERPEDFDDCLTGEERHAASANYFFELLKQQRALKAA